MFLADREEFADAAISALERATFRPATRHGTPVQERVFNRYRFELALSKQGAQSAANEGLYRRGQERRQLMRMW